MTQKKSVIHNKDSKKVFDAEAVRAELLEAYKLIPKEQMQIIKKIQAETLKEIPSSISLADELIKDRKRQKL